jgi:hypothetical protein
MAGCCLPLPKSNSERAALLALLLLEITHFAPGWLKALSHLQHDPVYRRLLEREEKEILGRPLPLFEQPDLAVIAAPLLLCV